MNDKDLEEQLKRVEVERDTPQQVIHEAIQSQTEDGGVLTKWVLMAEWVNPDGTKSLSQLSDDNSHSWDVNGLLHEGLFGDWGEEETDPE